MEQEDWENRSTEAEEPVTQAEVEAEAVECSVEELLISCVQARPALWDSRLSIKERSKTIRDQLWVEIFQEFGSNPEFPMEFLQKKWRNLRDTYVRLKGEYTPSGSAAIKKKKWEYWDLMTFLNDTINYRPTVSNLEAPRPSSSASCTPPLLSPSFSETGESSRTKKGPNIETTIIEAINKVNSAPIPVPVEEKKTSNPICSRISEMLEMMPQGLRTALEIKLLQVAYEGSKEYLNK